MRTKYWSKFCWCENFLSYYLTWRFWWK